MRKRESFLDLRKKMMDGFEAKPAKFESLAAVRSERSTHYLKSRVELMLIVIRDGEELSLKAGFVIQILRLNSTESVLYISRKNASKGAKKQADKNKIELATSTSGILAYFLLMLLKSPKDLSDGVISRLFNRQRSPALIGEGFLSILSQVLHYYFATSARTDEILPFLKKLVSPKIFLVDEFLSINVVNLKTLKNLGSIIYVSQDVAFNRYGFRDNLITKALMYKLERDAIALADLVIACSERDRLKYVEMGAKKSVFYPNIYPLKKFEPLDKDQSPSISIVSRGHWGSKADRSLEEIFKGLSAVNRKIKVYFIGVKPKLVPKNIILQHYEFIPNKLDFLNILSKSWIGINIGFHMAGSNERKYDYAMAELVVFSDNLGSRGDLLPHEYTYVDGHDLAAKLEQLLQFGKAKIEEMGVQNRKQALSLAEKQREKLLTTVNRIISTSIQIDLPGETAE